MGGRKSIYSEALAERICARIARGDSLAAVCRTEGMPPRPTVRRWLTQKGDFRERYARARLQAQTRYPDGWSDRHEVVAKAVCARIAGGESVDSACRRPGMPSRITLYRWLGQHAAFRQQYVLARQLQADALADEIMRIADTATDVGRARLQISARKQAVSRLAPVKYKASLARGGDGSLTIENLLELINAGAAAEGATHRQQTILES